MSNFIGKIVKIEEDNIGSVHFKKVVTLEKDNETCFFEFRNEVTMRLLKSFETGDEVAISYLHQGKKTRAGLRCNNLVAQTIVKIECTNI